VSVVFLGFFVAFLLFFFVFTVHILYSLHLSCGFSDVLFFPSCQDSCSRESWEFQVTVHRVATHLENLENLEKSGNLRVVREKRESGKVCSSIMVNHREAPVLIWAQNVQYRPTLLIRFTSV